MNRSHLKRATTGGLLVCAVALAAGCGPESSRLAPGDGGREDPLRGHTYLSTSVTRDGEPRPLVDGTRITLRFADNGRLLVDAGCNSMGGSASVSDGSLDVGDMSMTEMGCDPSRHKQDMWVSDLISGTTAWRLDGSRLTLTSGATRIVLLDQRVADPDRPLAKTRWQVNSLIDGEVASSAPSGRQRAHLRFENGKVRGNDGCNQLTGTAKVSGSTITFGSIVTTKMACLPAVAQTERSVLAVLDGKVRFSITADQLRLEHPSGKGLVLKAKPATR
jgi:heat shock protein HslJ